MFITITRTRAAVFALTAAWFFTALCAPGFLHAAQGSKEWDGLELRPSKRVDQLYVRADASLAGYKRVRLERLQVPSTRTGNRTRRGRALGV